MKCKHREELIYTSKCATSTGSNWYQVVSTGTPFPTYLGRNESINWETRGFTKRKIPLNNYCTHFVSELPKHPALLCSAPLGDVYYGIKCLTPTSWEWISYPSLQSEELAYSYNPYTAPLTAQDFLDFELENAYNTQKSIAASAVLGMMGKFTPNVTQSVLELKDAPQLLAGVVKLGELMHKIDQVAEGKRVRFKSMTLGDLAKADLWYEYGLKPTINDWSKVWAPLIRGEFDLFKQPLPGPGIKLRMPWSCSYQDDRSNLAPMGADLTFTSSTFNGNWMWQYAIEHNPGNQIVYRTSIPLQSNGTFNNQLNLWPRRARVWSAKGICYGMTEVQECTHCQELIYGLSKKSRFFRNHSQTAAGWEVIPFSFVVDWFFNIGQWIKLMDMELNTHERSLILLDGLWVTAEESCDTYCRTLNVNSRFNNLGNGYGNISWDLTPTWRLLEKRTRFLRAPYTRVPVLPVRLKLKRFQVGAMLALLLAKFSYLGRK